MAGYGKSGKQLAAACSSTGSRRQVSAPKPSPATLIRNLWPQGPDFWPLTLTLLNLK